MYLCWSNCHSLLSFVNSHFPFYFCAIFREKEEENSALWVSSKPKQQTVLAGISCSKCLVIWLVCFSYIMNFFNSIHLIFISPLILHCPVPQILGPKCPRLIIYTVIVFQHKTIVGLPHIHLFFIHWPAMHLIYTQCPSVEPYVSVG